jgi:dihydroorotase
MKYDLLLKGGTLIDPGQGIHSVKDVAFKDGKVAEIGTDLDGRQSHEVLDCTSLIVAPGLVDLHVHGFWGCSHYGIEPDPHFISKGVTTALDVGSAGADTFPGFRKYVIEKSDTRLFALLHISSQGMLCPEIGELKYIEYANVDKAVKTIERNRDIILGVKVRLTNSLVAESAGLEPLRLARQAADTVGLPLMVHPQDARCDALDDILGILKKNDIVTHCFHGHRHGILNEDGSIRESVLSARQRGILFDVGHGQGSFRWQVAEKALAQGFFPDTISSDLHFYNTNGPVFDLATTISKFLYLGLGLEDALAKAAVYPAQILGISDRIGTLKQGAEGDAVVLKIETGAFDLWDAHEQRRTGEKRMVVAKVVAKGKVYR